MVVVAITVAFGSFGSAFGRFWQISTDYYIYQNCDNYTKFSRSPVMCSAGLTMWQMSQMPRASGLRGASGSRENFFQPVSIQVI